MLAIIDQSKYPIWCNNQSKRSHARGLLRFRMGSNRTPCHWAILPRFVFKIKSGHLAPRFGTHALNSGCRLFYHDYLDQAHKHTNKHPKGILNFTICACFFVCFFCLLFPARVLHDASQTAKSKQKQKRAFLLDLAVDGGHTAYANAGGKTNVRCQWCLFSSVAQQTSFRVLWYNL